MIQLLVPADVIAELVAGHICPNNNFWYKDEMHRWHYLLIYSGQMVLRQARLIW